MRRQAVLIALGATLWQPWAHGENIVPLGEGLQGLYFPAPHPAPAVIMMHGCGGAYGRDGALSARFRLWIDDLTRQGAGVLLVDGFSQRGIREICTQRHADRQLKPSDRVNDVWTARRWLAMRPEVQAENIALIGWSHGGSTVLQALRNTPPNTPAFTAAIAFYPGCTTLAKATEAYRPASPLMVLIGERDNWTPADSCRALASRTPSMQLTVYPGAYHGFDDPAGVLKIRQDVPNGVQPGQGVTVGPHPMAREDARRRVANFLRETLFP